MIFFEIKGDVLKDFFGSMDCLYLQGFLVSFFETQQLHIVHFLGVIDTSLHWMLRQTQRPTNS